jgi:RNA polymerase sigma-70 factor, ECF subfamily
MMDETRFRAFYQQMYPRLWSYVNRMVSDRAQCDDHVQESFLRFLRAAPSKLADAECRSYLYRIATNIVKDAWRVRQTEKAWLDEQSGEEPRAESEGAIGTGIDIARALELLTPGQRSLVWLAYVEGYEHEEIAEIVGVKAASVRVLLMRARKRLAGFLSEDLRGTQHD